MPATRRIFHAWMENWEKEKLMINDCTVEAQFLQKYKNLVFHDPDNNQVYTVFGDNLEFHRRSKKKGVTGGWGLICMGKDGIEEAFEICKMTIDLIAEHPQEEGIKIIHPGEGGEDV